MGDSLTLADRDTTPNKSSSSNKASSFINEELTKAPCNDHGNKAITEIKTQPTQRWTDLRYKRIHTNGVEGVGKHNSKSQQQNSTHGALYQWSDNNKVTKRGKRMEDKVRFVI